MAARQVAFAWTLGMDPTPMDFTYFEQVHALLPIHAVQDEMARYLSEWPAEEDSDAIPPGLVNGRVEGLDFETVLGTYDRVSRRITVWTSGVEAVSGLIGLHPELLRRVVRLHEGAHAVHHRGYDRAALRSPDAVGADIALHELAFGVLMVETGEQVAQLATLAALRTQLQAARDPGALNNIQAMLNGFRALMRRQSAPYRLPEIVFEMPMDRLRGKIRLLLDLTDAGVSFTAKQAEGILD